MIPVSDLIRYALAEDTGQAGDITSAATVPVMASAKVVMRARKSGVLSGVEMAAATFIACDPLLDVTVHLADGDAVRAGEDVLTVHGRTQSILMAERTALNFASHLSGVATLTRAYVDKTAGTKARICCTRKTTPLLRELEKAAVRHGGGVNHRFGLFDAILIKDNHIAACGGDAVQALLKARAAAGHMVKIEIEVDTVDQLKSLLPHRPDIVLLDNFTPDQLQQAVALAAGTCVLEASGGVSLDSVAAIAATGVDLISVGALTHSAPVLDLGLDSE